MWGSYIRIISYDHSQKLHLFTFKYYFSCLRNSHKYYYFINKIIIIIKSYVYYFTLIVFNCLSQFNYYAKDGVEECENNQNYFTNFS